MMNVEKKGFDEFAKMLKQGPAIVRKEMSKAIKNSVIIVQLAAKNTVSIGATGELKRSIMTQVDEQNLIGIVGLDVPGRQYGIYVEKGSKPHWIPIAAIKRWAEQKGINPYAVQASIAKKGTKPHPFMTPAYEKNKPFIKRQFSNANQNIVRSLNHGN